MTVLWTLKLGRHPVSLVPISASFVDRDAGLAAARAVGVGALEVLPGAVEPVGLVGPVVLAGLELVLELCAPVGLHLVDLLGGEEALGDEPLGVELERRLVRPDLRIHQRLGEARLVAFVVAEAAVAEHVDDDGLAEALAELGRDLGGVDHGLGIVAVHVEDRRLDHLGDVGRVGR